MNETFWYVLKLAFWFLQLHKLVTVIGNNLIFPHAKKSLATLSQDLIEVLTILLLCTQADTHQPTESVTANTT